MNTLIGLCLIAGVALFIASMKWTFSKFIAWKKSREPEYQTEHEFDAAEFWERRP